MGNNILAIGANDGKVYGLNSNNGKKIWEFDCGHGNAFLRDVLFHNDIFYFGLISPGKSSGYLFALPWHLGEYEKVAKIYTSEGEILESANFLAVAAHFAIKGRQELEENAANGWIECGKPGMAVQYWLGMAKPEKAAKCWETAAESFRGKNNAVAAEQYYQASRIYWRIGDTVNEKSCFHKAVELGNGRFCVLKFLITPFRQSVKQES